jgi:hypothetical protein
MKLPIDTERFTFICAVAPAPLPSKEAALPDEQDQQRRRRVQLVLLSDTVDAIVHVQLAAALPAEVMAGARVLVHGLTATPWSDGEEVHLLFEAEAVTPLPPHCQLAPNRMGDGHSRRA